MSQFIPQLVGSLGKVKRGIKLVFVGEELGIMECEGCNVGAVEGTLDGALDG